jgi:predicted DNA-binding transcriptional regulator AlpA
MIDDALFAKLQHAHDDQIVGVLEVAILLNTTEGCVYKLSSQEPQKLPPRITIFGKKLAWRLGTCRQWIRGLKTDKPDTIFQTKRIGRPRLTDSHL